MTADPRPRRELAERPGPAAPAGHLGSPSAALLAWFDAHRRDLPWRRDPSPYATLVSEFMLQQTRVETVVPYFEAFLRRFPTLGSLAAAREEDVLKFWEGLGYYRRARQLLRAAQLASERHGGVPADEAALRELPGVGPYMAAAIASIAFGHPVAAVDGNVRRVLSRVFDRDLDPDAARALAARLVDRARPGDWNQALMDLGATVCRPRRPSCGACPLSTWCRSRRRGTVASRPAPRSRPAPPVVWRPTLLWTAGGRVLVERRPAGGLLGGLWGFPGVETDDAARGAQRGRGDAAVSLARRHGFVPSSLAPVPDLEYVHVFTHRVWRVTPYVPLPGLGAARPRGGEGGVWVDVAELPSLPMPRAFEPLRAAVLDGRIAGGGTEP